MKGSLSIRFTTTVFAFGVAALAPSIGAQQTSSSTMTSRDSTACARMRASGSSSGTSSGSSASSSSMTASDSSAMQCRTARRNRRRARAAASNGVSGASGVTGATSSQRIPITKNETAPAAAPAVSSTVTPHTTTVAVSTPVDTTTVAAVVAPEPDTTSAAGIVATPILRPRRFGNGFYIGLGAGAAMPVGGVRNAYNTGLNVSVPFGWDAPLGPLGFQGTVAYNTFGARSTFRNAGDVNGSTGAVALTNVNPQIWSALADAKLRLPWMLRFTGGATTGLYAIGGVGVHYIRNYSTTFGVTNPFTNLNDQGAQNASVSNSGSLTRFGWNAGGGLSLGLGGTELFVESRYVRIMTSSERTSYVPLLVGLTFR
jgi:hypothetical protein